MRKLIGFVAALFILGTTAASATDWPPKQVSTKIGLVTFEAQRVIPKDFVDHPVVRFLIAKQKFDFDSETNVVYLPTDAKVATKLKMSPYSKEPIDTYRRGVEKILSQIGESLQFKKAQRGDHAALNRVVAAFDLLQSSMREALPQAKLYVGYPEPE